MEIKIGRHRVSVWEREFISVCVCVCVRVCKRNRERERERERKEIVCSSPTHTLTALATGNGASVDWQKSFQFNFNLSATSRRDFFRWLFCYWDAFSIKTFDLIFFWSPTSDISSCLWYLSSVESNKKVWTSTKSEMKNILSWAPPIKKNVQRNVNISVKKMETIALVKTFVHDVWRPKMTRISTIVNKLSFEMWDFNSNLSLLQKLTRKHLNSLSCISMPSHKKPTIISRQTH